MEFAEEIMQLLKQIERGEVTLVPEYDPASIFAGDVHYSASNGWKLVVFNDCNEWDYLDSVTAPDGRVMGFDTMWEAHMELIDYHPTVEVAVRAYGFPQP